MAQLPELTIVLVHGAFADASSWTSVIRELHDDGPTVTAIAHPLRGLADDSAYVASLVHQIDGPVVLVGHSYGGMVITQAADGLANAVALVYVAAFIPDIGESIDDINASYPATATPPDIRPQNFPTAHGAAVELLISPASFPAAFAADLPLDTSSVLAVTQRPPALACFQERAARAAWTHLPSWALIATDDQMINPDAERAMASRAGSQCSEVSASHAVALSQPAAVADIIREATRAVHSAPAATAAR
jgi:pimeloyl-ACP methyl ester carboxylesterase